MRHGKATADPAFVIELLLLPALRERKCTECACVSGVMLNSILNVLRKTRIHTPAVHCSGRFKQAFQRRKDKSNPWSIIIAQEFITGVGLYFSRKLC